MTALAAGFMMQYIMESPDERAARGVQVASIAEAANQQTVTDAIAQEPTLAETPILDGPQQAVLGDAALAEPAVEEPGLDKNADNAPETPALTNADQKVENVVAGAPTPPGIASQPEVLPIEPVKVAALDDVTVNPASPRQEPTPAFECESKVVALPSAGAMVELLIDTNCYTNSGFTVHHNGMMVSGMTDSEGLAAIILPALAEQAVYMVSFPDGDTITANAEVTSVPDYDRAIVQWSAYDGLQVHALEYGATYDEPGHIWSGAQGEILDAAKGEGGFIMRIGESTPITSHMVEVYTFPTGTALREGTVQLNLEAVVTEANCGQDLTADVLQKSGEGSMVVREVTLAMPDCDAIGDFLVLNNMFDDLNIARN
ncbi:MAG: hypothetical protein AAF231_03085 [Pseudomonadota bacterium]